MLVLEPRRREIRHRPAWICRSEAEGVGARAGREQVCLGAAGLACGAFTADTVEVVLDLAIVGVLLLLGGVGCFLIAFFSQAGNKGLDDVDFKQSG